ncbi:MAG: hypothetical protein MI724_18900 [Spirochaetales bacterium]|nr:hypothetical protein [Spirochaetales bacterium]
MPSHISHALLAEECGARLETPPQHALLVLGAQGPDIFLHNHRRKPRGFRYGALLHRKGNAELLSSLALSAHRADAQREEDGEAPGTGDRIEAYALGYISHVWFDRLAHPYINFRAGWRGVPDRHPDRPAMHAFLERLIDVTLLRRLRDMGVDEYRFVDRLPDRVGLFFRLRPIVVEAIRASLVSAREDANLPRRLQNALYDSLSFYRHTESPDRQYFMSARAREREGTVSSRWLSVVHPPEELIDVDVLNIEGRTWAHPCDDERRSDATVPGLFHEARLRTVESFALWRAVRLAPSSSNVSKLIDTIGPWNLNDGLWSDPPCHRRSCAPLPLLELYETMKRSFERTA